MASRLRSRVPALIAALALTIQLLALPFHHPVPAPSRAEAAAIELRALLGDSVVLCTQADDSIAPNVPRQRHCGEECPLCQFAGHVANLIVPPLGSTVIPPARTSLAIVAGPESVDRRTQLNPLAQARAPPLVV